MAAFSGSERRIVILSSAAHALVHAEMLAFAIVLLPMGADLGLSLGELGALGTLSYLCFGAGAPAAGWLADRWGARRVLVACMLGSAAAATDLSLARGRLQVAAALVALGLAASLYHPAGLGLLSKRVRSLGPALAAHGVAGNLGLALTPLGAAALAEAFGWRAPYVPLAVLAAVLAIALLTLDGERATAPPPPSGGRLDRRALVILLGLAPVLGLVYRGTLTFLPLRFLEATTTSQPDHALSQAGIVTSAALLGGMLGQLLGGRALGRGPAELSLVIALAAAAPLSAALGLLRGPALIAAAFCFVVVHFANQPLTNALLAEASPPGLRSRVYGASFVLSFGVGAFAAGAGGLLAQSRGVAVVFLGIAGLGVLAFGLALALWSSARGRPGQRVRRTVPSATGAFPRAP